MEGTVAEAAGRRAHPAGLAGSRAPGRHRPRRRTQRALLKDEGRPVTASYITDPAGRAVAGGLPHVEPRHHVLQLRARLGVLHHHRRGAAGGAAPDDGLLLPRVRPRRRERRAAAWTTPSSSRRRSPSWCCPSSRLQKAPLAINASILTHEYAHLVFNRRVYGGRALPEPIQSWSRAEGSHARASTSSSRWTRAWRTSTPTWPRARRRYGCNTRILATSFEGQPVEDRDLTNYRSCMTQELYQQLYGAPTSTPVQPAASTRWAPCSRRRSTRPPHVAGRPPGAGARGGGAYSDTNTAKPGLAQLASATTWRTRRTSRWAGRSAPSSSTSRPERRP